MRKAIVYVKNVRAGVLTEDSDGYHFAYDASYVGTPVSLTMPVKELEYTSSTMFSFFDGLIPEGWLLATAHHNWKIDVRDRMGLLLVCCNDCIGDVSVKPAND